MSEKSIVVFGATGYTGRLLVAELVASGVRPVIAGRSSSSLDALSRVHGGLMTRVADVSKPETVMALVQKGDVLVSTVGPFAKWGNPAVEAAIAAGATYLDSTGEPVFIRRIFEHYGPLAKKAGSALLTAVGYDWVPGNTAAALAVRMAGANATRVDVGYFSYGDRIISAGTHASMIGAISEPSFAFRNGRIVAERGTAHCRSFKAAKGVLVDAASIGATEQFSLPILYPHLKDVNVYLAMASAKQMPFISAIITGLVRMPGGQKLLNRLTARPTGTSTDGPDKAARAKSSSMIVAEAYAKGGKLLARTELDGVNGYEFTARFTAWASIAARDGEVMGTGALGPVEAFGLDEIATAVSACGFTLTTTQ